MVPTVKKWCIGLAIAGAFQCSTVLAQPCPFEPLGPLHGETGVCVLSGYRFLQGDTEQSLVSSAIGTASALYDRADLFTAQIPQPSNISTPYFSSSKIIALGSPDSATGFRVEQRGRAALTPGDFGGEYSQEIAYESHARVTFRPFVPGGSSSANVSVVLQFTQKFRLTDDAAGGADSGETNGGANIMLRDFNEVELVEHISGMAFLNPDAGENPNLWNAFETGGSSVSCGDGCQDITVSAQRVAEVQVNTPLTVDAYTFGVARNFSADADGTVYSNDNQDTAVITVSSPDPKVRFVLSDDLPSFGINAGMNDVWYNDATNGQGMLISVFPDRKEMFLAWFTFDVERPPENVTALLGEPGHRWLTAQGPYDGNTANLTIYMTGGGVFDSADPAPATDLAGDGTLTMTFSDCLSGTARYPIAALGLSGVIPIQRVVADNVPLCESLYE